MDHYCSMVEIHHEMSGLAEPIDVICGPGDPETEIASQPSI